MLDIIINCLCLGLCIFFIVGIFYSVKLKYEDRQAAMFKKKMEVENDASSKEVSI